MSTSSRGVLWDIKIVGTGMLGRPVQNVDHHESGMWGGPNAVDLP